MELSHVSLVVPDIDAAIRRLRDVYGLNSGEVRENCEQDVRLCYVDLGNSRLELIQPLTPDSAVGRFLAKHPAGGLHHLCFGVGVIAEAKSKLEQRGVRILGAGARTFNVDGQEIAFIYPLDFFGALVEIERGRCEGS